jgi:hypothetical protein
MRDKSQDILALVLKQMGGSVLVEKQTFMEIEDNYEIMLQRNMDGNLVIELVEDQSVVVEMRAQRAAEIKRKEALGRILVP